MQVVQEQAQARMYDLWPESTVVHWHPASETCDEKSQHRIYDHEAAVIVNYDEGQGLPRALREGLKEKKSAMSDNWFKNSGP
jgi:hypothetical protein